ncbi:MAG: sporulation membrane protein YtaF [Firmicutes bacterium]|jgi:putative sporulation protein YtaF|nr:sporulation membrane protein YtaF [Bacillota bacterium]
MDVVALLLLSLAISMDGFGVGLCYGLRRIRVPLGALAIIGISSALAVGATMSLGHLASTAFAPRVGRVVSAIVLVGMGVWLGLEGVLDGAKEKAAKDGDPDAALLSVRLRPLGVVLQVMRDPEIADVDRSGTISPREAVLLGTSLTLDALGAGFGAGVGGLFSFMAVLLVGAMQSALVTLGFRLGSRVPEGFGGLGLRLAPGGILILMGLITLI